MADSGRARLNLTRGWIGRIIDVMIQQSILIIRAPTIYVDGLDENTTDAGITVTPTKVNLANLPTSSSGLASGDLWNNSNVINIIP